MDVFLNLLLFTPFGAGLRLAGWSWRRVVATAALVSFSVELLQYTVVTGRDASLSDLLTNTTGAAAAAAVVPQWRRMVLPLPRTATRCFAAWAALWIGILAGAVWLQSPRTLRGPVRNRWPETAMTDRAFGGRVLEARVNGVAMPREDAPFDRAAIRRALDRGDVTVDLRAVSGRPTEDLAMIYGLLVRRVAVLGVAQYGRDAVLIAPSRAQRLRIWAPTLQLRDAFPPDTGVPVTISGALHDRQLRLRVSWGGRVQETTMLLRPTLGWAAVAPLQFVLGRRVRLLTACWVGALAFPLGLWAAALPRRPVALAALGAAIVAGLAGIPALASAPPSHWTEWGAALAGASLGWAGARFAAYLLGRCGSPSTSESSSS